ncbi:MAG: transglutaminase-like domain-containing protein [Bacteroidetes bacterium]|nr:transglutaminase-like domain-containing protein [Bacteroidota bacterium]
MKKFFFLSLLVAACVPVTNEDIITAIHESQFTKADSLIKHYLCQNDLPILEQLEWHFQIDRMQRIRSDFSATDSTVLLFLKNYYTEEELTSEQLLEWEESNALEWMMIDGEKRYFNNAARNLFRIDPLARKRWEAVNGNQPDSLNRFLAKNLPGVVTAAKWQYRYRNTVNPVNMEVTYTLTVKPDAVPEGEVIRAWLPLPRTDIPRQTNFKLGSTCQPDYIVAPEHFDHKTIYMEQKAVAGEPTVFTYSFSYTAYAQWFDVNPDKLQPYNTQSELYQTYTAQRAPHILFSERIQQLCKEVVGDEQNPYLKVKKIYEWIDQNFPWASAREYSTLANIPEYVLDNRHGDCGQVSLLFITMARCAGVPAKWQSGFMMHPGNKNLHDWAEVYYEGIGWVPVDQSFGRMLLAQDDEVYWFFTKGIDAYHLVVNQDISQPLYPAKTWPRSETVDFQRGEVEWRGGNLYFGDWRYRMDISYK